jgi:hypothetical protein
VVHIGWLSELALVTSKSGFHAVVMPELEKLLRLVRDVVWILGLSQTSSACEMENVKLETHSRGG